MEQMEVQKSHISNHFYAHLPATFLPRATDNTPVSKGFYNRLAGGALEWDILQPRSSILCDKFYDVTPNTEGLASKLYGSSIIPKDNGESGSPYRNTTDCDIFSRVGQRETGGFSKLKGFLRNWSYARHLLFLLLTVTMLIAVGVYLIFASTENVPSRPAEIPKADEGPEKSTTLSREDNKFQHLSKECIINSPEELANSDGCETLVIEYLVDETPPPVKKGDDKVLLKVVKVQGPTSEDWLEYILKRSEGVSELSLNIDQMCIGSKEADRESLPSLKLGNIQFLRLQDAHLCPLMNWVFSWGMEGIKEISIENADINRLTFPPLDNFVGLYKETLKNLVIRKSNMCSDDCEFDDEIREQVKVQIEDMVELPDYEDFDDI